MSTIKSSSANLTLNADGSGNDIKFQSNAVEKASISDAGLFTSTTIDATVLTGNLPAIDGSSLTGIAGRRNMIINGDMRVAQRGTSSTTENYATVDRFRSKSDGTDELVLTQSQSTTAPDGFRNSWKLQSTTAETAWTTTEIAAFRYYTEAQDMQHLKYGTSDAQSITLSFWVRAEVTGTYAVQIYSQDGDRCIGSTYVINVADTWEKKTMTFAGDTGGTINDDNGRGLQITWYLGVGTDAKSSDNTSWGTNATAKQAYGHTADWGTATSHDYHITGVQLEVGSVATDFEHRSVGEELALCQRYYWRLDRTTGSGNTIAIGSNYSTSIMVIDFPTVMRDAPTTTIVGSNYSLYSNTTDHGANSLTFSNFGTKSGRFGFALAGTRGEAFHFDLDNDDTYIEFNAEL